MSGYEIIFKLGPFWIGKDSSQYFIGRNCDGFYVALYLRDLAFWRCRKCNETQTLFWKHLLGGKS